MRIGIHLPQFGKAITPGGVQRAAREAEQEGFDDVWVSDHLVNPQEQSYPAPYILDPLITLALAAGATERIGLGTSVLVGPQYTSPLALANSLASLDAASDGRLTLGIGIGWSKREYEALGASFSNRGARLDEMLRLFRNVWEHSTADFEGEFYPSFEQIRVLPLPAHRIPIWIGGSADPAIERALRHDGSHAIGLSPEQLTDVVTRLRGRRPDDDFVISLRVSWDLTTKDPHEMADEAEAYRDAGCGALHISPERGDLDTWLRGQAAVAGALVAHA
jgi:probable F420-dependent oxidoreductase